MSSGCSFFDLILPFALYTVTKSFLSLSLYYRHAPAFTYHAHYSLVPLLTRTSYISDPAFLDHKRLVSLLTFSAMSMRIMSMIQDCTLAL